MPIYLPQAETYEVPEGEYRAVVRDAFEYNEGKLRITFELRANNILNLTYLAGKNYEANDPALGRDLTEWLGQEGVSSLLNPDGSLDYARLRGRQADIRISLIRNRKYPTPFRNVQRITAPGRLVADYPRAA